MMDRLTVFAERIRTRFYVELDLFHWRRQTVSLKQLGKPDAKKKVLFCNLFSSVAGAKAEALFAHFLEQRGYAVTVVLSGRNRITERIFSSVNAVGFIYLDTYSESLDAGDIEYQTRVVLQQGTTVQKLLDVTLDKVRVGKNALSWVARQLRAGSIDLSDSRHKALVEETIKDSITALRAGQAIISEMKPDIALFLERGYTPAGEIFDLCIAAGINTIQWLGAPQSGSFLFKRYDENNQTYHPLALDPNSWQKIKAMDWSQEREDSIMEKLQNHYKSGAWFNRQQLQENKTIKTRTEIVSQLGLNPTKKIAVIFTHILYDATFFYGESLFADYAEWLVETVREAIANPNLNWLVKVHPVNVWRSAADGVPMEQLEATLLRDAFGKLPDHVKIIPADTDINTYSLFDTIDYGLTVRGTIGMELPCYGITTITAGSGRYSGNGFTIDPETINEYRFALAELHFRLPMKDEEIKLARRYAFGTFFLRPIPINYFNFDHHANSYGLPIFASNTFVIKASYESEDMNEIANWMADGYENDFLNWKGVELNQKATVSRCLE